MQNKLQKVPLILLSLLAIVTILHFGSNFAKFIEVKPSIVVIRIDDIQDFAFKEAQLALLEHGIANEIPLSLAIIPQIFGADFELVDLVKRAIQHKAEVAVHGWKHEDLTQFSLIEQKRRLFQGKIHLEVTTNCSTSILVPPMFSYNNDTINAMSELKYDVISGLAELQKPGMVSNEVINIAGTIELSNYEDKKWQMKTIDTVLTELAISIQTHGYAVIVTHPQEFIRNEEISIDLLKRYETIIEKIGERYSFTTLERLGEKFRT
jgi:predicted deacetylase